MILKKIIKWKMKYFWITENQVIAIFSYLLSKYVLRLKEVWKIKKDSEKIDEIDCSIKREGTSLCVLDSMCPCLYVSISLCVQGSMWQISCRIDPLWLWFYVSRVLCGPGSMWPLMYKLTLCVVGPMCPGSNVTNALCVHGSMWP